MQEKETEGISLFDICKTIWKRKIMVAIITGVTLILVTLLVVLWYNPSKVTYTSSFELSFKGSEEDVLPNGNVYNYKDIVSKENLLKVRNSNEKYAGLDIEKIYRKDAFKITRDTDDNNEYILKITRSKITDLDLMADFVEDLVGLTIASIEENSQMIYYVEELNKFNNYEIYTDAINYLIEQTNVLVNSYTRLISSYGESYVINGKSLKVYRNEALNIIENASLDYYLTLAEKNMYVRDEVAKQSFADYAKSKIEALKRQREYNNRMLEGYKDLLTTSNSNYTNITSQMESIIKENAEIDLELESLCSSYTTNFEEYVIREAVVADSSFTLKITEIYQTIEEVMQQLEDNTKDIYLETIILNYDSKAIVVETGTLNIIVAIIMGLILGLVIATVIVLIIELPQLTKKEDVKKEQEA